MQPRIDTISMKAAAKMLGIGPIVLRRLLQDREIFSTGSPALPRTQYIHMGYFRTELTTYNTGGVDNYHTKALVTAKGIAFIRELLDQNEVVARPKQRMELRIVDTPRSRTK